MLERRQFIKTALAVAAASLASAGRGSLFGADASPGTTYTVKPGDTLGRISQRFGITTDALRSRNGLSGDRILIGQLLVITPPPAPATKYTVQAGDTLGKIAARHQTTVAALRAENGLSGDRIYPGQALVISGAAAVAASSRYIGEVMRVTRGVNTRQRPWRYIIAHHSGVNSGNAAAYDRFHRKNMRMSNGLAYHFVIGNGKDSGNGEIEIGDRWVKQLQGGHVRSYRMNEMAIGICLVGNFEQRHPTAPQVAALTELVHYLKNDLLGGQPKFMVHREVDGSQTLCPGKHFPTSRMHQMFS